jgi:hypothetical protein
MYERLGFSNEMALYIRDNQGIDSMAKLQNLDDASVKALCQAMKKLGRTTLNPNNGAPGV